MCCVSASIVCRCMQMGVLWVHRCVCVAEDSSPESARPGPTRGLTRTAEHWHGEDSMFIPH